MPSPTVSFSHIELYVDRIEEISVYKDLERKVNLFCAQVDDNFSMEEKQKLWSRYPIAEFMPQNRDIVQQLIVGLQFRVTRVSDHSLLVTSKDVTGVQFLITKASENATGFLSKGTIFMRYFFSVFVCLVGFDLYSFSLHMLIHVIYVVPGKHDRFVQAHAGHCGIGVLAFKVDNVEEIKDRYQELHPKLVASYDELDGQVKVLEVFAYYQNHQHTTGNEKEADLGTVLRFVQTPSDDALYGSMGLNSVQACFPNQSRAAYFDHWVSNVFSRTEFIETLHDTLGFSPKVDFNAGVVAAGEAQIESTVTGNTSLVAGDPTEALRDQSQVYLPINNALSPVGHVHGFLQELGQGIQHVASRVENIVDFVQRANDMRKITGEGFSFLRIPRSYYGILTMQDLMCEGNGNAIDKKCALAIVNALEADGVLSKDGALNLDLTREGIDAILTERLAGSVLQTYDAMKTGLLDKICFSRYQNLYSLLGKHVSEATYLAIVRNQILVDIQGEDLLYQIFTCNILQQNSGDEAPFLEFIQRVCSECTDVDGCPRKVKPGCGGFGKNIGR